MMRSRGLFWSAWLLACFFAGMAGRAYYEAAAADAPAQATCGCGGAGCRCGSRVLRLGGGLVDLSEVWMVQPGEPAPKADAVGVVLVYRRGSGGSHPVEDVTDVQWRALLDAFGGPPPQVSHPEKPPARPTLSIAVPAPGDKVEGASVLVKAALGGAVDRVMHWHLQLDDGAVVTLDQKAAVHTFGPVPPGDHLLAAWLSDHDHKDVPGSRVEVPFSTTIPPPPLDPAPLPPLPTAPVATVTVAVDLTEIGVGGSTTARAIARAADGTTLTGRTVTWTTSDPKVATVDLGKVQGIAPGSASITATVEGKTGSAPIKVVAPDAGHEHEHGKPPEAGGTARKAVKPGQWSDKATWGGTLPADGDTVSISAEVLYDLADGPRLPTLTVEAGGTLRYPPDRSTITRFGSIWVASGGLLEIGTADAPVHPDVSHELIRLDLPLDTARYPDQLDGGLVAYGTVRIHGAPKTSGPIRVTAEPLAGHTTLVLEQPVSGWRPGDLLVISGSANWGYDKYELPTIRDVSADGKTLVLDKALVWDHPGARDGDGKLDFLPHVGNLSHNVIIRSENPAGVRGHTLYTERADVDIRHAEFRDLGRTRLNIIDSATTLPFSPATLTPLDRGTAGHPLRAFVYGTEGTFRVDLTDGDYEVTVTLGDAAVGHDRTSVWVQDQPVAEGVDVAAGKPWEGTYPATVSAGSLRVRLSGSGGADPNFTLVGLRVRPAGRARAAVGAGKAFAFGPAGSMAIAGLEAGATSVAADPYTAARGYGWTTGSVGHVGTNQIGRYHWHAHHLRGPAGGRPDGRQFVVSGCSMWNKDPIGLTVKWGLAVHASHFGLIQGNVIFNVAGSGLVTEDGDETGNVFERNFIVHVAGTEGDARELSAGRGHVGTGVYLAGMANVVRNNVVADCLNDAYAFAIFDSGIVRIPTKPGQDPSSYITVNMHGYLSPDFSGNEGYATKVGMTVWHIGVPGPADRNVIKDLRLWHMGQIGIYFYPSDRVRLDGLKVRGGDYRAQAIINGHYSVPGMEIVNSDIQGCWMGPLIPTINNASNAPILIENTYLRNTINLVAATLEGQFGEENVRMPRHIILRNVRFGTPAHVTEPDNIEYLFAPKPNEQLTYNYNVIEEDWIEVYDYNGVKGDNFRIYKPEQAPDYIIPATGSFGGHIFLGAPEPGLTNAQAWERYVRDPTTGKTRLRKLPEDKDLPGIAIGGAVAPKGAVRRPGIDGFVVPLEPAGR